MNLNIINNMPYGSIISPGKIYDNAELFKTTILSENKNRSTARGIQPPGGRWIWYLSLNK